MDSTDSTDLTAPSSASGFSGVSRNRWLAIGLFGVVALVGVVVLAQQSSSPGDIVAIPLQTPTTTTTTTTVAPTTTTTSTTTSTTSTTTTVLTTTTTSTTTTTTLPPPTTTFTNGVPTWPPYELLPPLDGVAALTGEPADEAVTARPILAVKIDNFRSGRPQWGLDEADVVIEENVEGVTRFVALFHSRLPDRAGPVRSARTGDLDLLAAMNRPILGWSGGNRGVTNWVESAASSGVLVDFTAQRNRCYNRSSSRRAPHNLLLNTTCAVDAATTAGAARPLWAIDAAWTPPSDLAVVPDTTFEVTMDGVRVEWTWDATSEMYLRSQDGQAHMAVSGARISARNVVEISTFHAPSPVDARSPNPITVGGTDVIVHRDGVAIPGKWFRETAYDSFRFFDPATGAAIPLDSGKSFIELVRDR